MPGNRLAGTPLERLGRTLTLGVALVLHTASALTQALLVLHATTRLAQALDAAGIAYERRLFHLLYGTADQKEGMSAFAEKRKPSFEGK